MAEREADRPPEQTVLADTRFVIIREYPSATRKALAWVANFLYGWVVAGGPATALGSQGRLVVFDDLNNRNLFETTELDDVNVDRIEEMLNNDIHTMEVADFYWKWNSSRPWE